MNALDTSSYFSRVAYSLDNNEISNWFQVAIGKDKNDAQIETEASELLKNLPKEVSSSSKRYRCEFATSRNQLLLHVFNQTVTHPKCLKAAENISQKKFYSTWRKFVYISLPKCGANIFENSFVKVAASVSITALALWSIYRFTDILINQSLPVIIPKVINNTPLSVIRTSNTTLDWGRRVFKNKITTLIGIWLIKRILTQGPRISYLTALAHKVNLWAVYCILIHSPESLRWFFLFERIIVLIDIGCEVCSALSEKCEFLAKKGEDEQLAVCRQKTAQIWVKALHTA